MFHFYINRWHVGGEYKGSQERKVVSAVSHGCVLEEDVTNIHEFAMDNWDERWIEGQGFSLFYRLELFGLHGLGEIRASGFDAEAEIEAMLFGVCNHAYAEAFRKSRTGRCS